MACRLPWLSLLLHVAAGLQNGLGLLPVRGVSSWCVQGACGWDRCWETEYEALANAMVSEGFRDANYTYLVVDDCWVAGRNATTGELYPDPTRFPKGMAHLAEYVHKLGLRLGLYTDVTSHPCVHGQYEREHGNVPGSLGHYDVDAATFGVQSVPTHTRTHVRTHAHTYIHTYIHTVHKLIVTLIADRVSVPCDYCPVYLLQHDGAWIM